MRRIKLRFWLLGTVVVVAMGACIFEAIGPTQHYGGQHCFASMRTSPCPPLDQRTGRTP